MGRLVSLSQLTFIPRILDLRYSIPSESNQKFGATQHMYDMESYIMALQFYFSRVFRVKFFLSMFNTYEFIPENMRTFGTSFLTKITPRKLRLYYFTELSDIFISAFLTKNLYFITRWIKHHIEKRPIKLLKLMRQFIKKIFSGFYLNLKSQLPI